MTFSMNLYRQIALENPGNFFISSASVRSAMAIATAAANGETEAQLSRVLDLHGDYEEKHCIYGVELQAMKGDNLSFANRFWVNDEYTLKPEYCSFVSDVYETKISGLDVSDPVNESDRINRWVAKNTGGRIKDISSPDAINSDLIATLINAIAYKGSWETKFEEYATYENSWTLPDRTNVQALQMHNTLDCPYFVGEGFHSVALALEGDVDMVIVLPTNGESLDALIARLEETDIVRVMNAEPRSVAVGLNKWSTSGSYKLVPTFQALGVSDAFSGSSADFSRMVDVAGVYITSIIHKTFIAVDENGAEMTAATKVDFGLESCFMGPMPIPFTTDRPFAYFAVERNTKTVLFSGRVTDPRS